MSSNLTEAEKVSQTVFEGIDLASVGLHRLREMADSPDGPSLAEIEEMNATGMQYVFNQVSEIWQWVPKGK